MSDLRTGGDAVGSARRHSPDVIDLREEGALQPAVTGGKAAALARAVRAGLDDAAGRRPHHRLLGGGRPRPARARPPSGAGGVRTGRRRPPVARRPQLVGGRGHGRLVDGRPVRLGHRHRRASTSSPPRCRACSTRGRAPARPTSPIAVLVQPLHRAARSAACMFGIDPVTGRTDRRVVSAVHGGPEPLVSGEVDGSRVPARRATARSLEFDAERRPAARPVRPAPARRRCRSRVARVFGGPQDVEWAIDDDGTLWLLQSRPVTTEVRGVPAGPIYGPGPGRRDVPRAAHRARARPLGPAAARRGARGGAARRHGDPRRGRRRARSSCPSTATSPSTCASPARSVPSATLCRRLNPVPAARRLRGAWRVGRLRAGPAPPGRAPPRPGRRRPRGGAGARRAHEPPAHRACCTAARRSSVRCTRTRSSWACSPTPAATG